MAQQPTQLPSQTNSPVNTNARQHTKFNMNQRNYFSKLIATLLVCFSLGQLFAQDLQADNMLLAQRASGGWSKHFQDKALDYNAEFSAEKKAAIIAEAKKDDANIDNGSTAKEIRYLVKIYKKTNNAQYLAAAEKGIQFLLHAQYENGGWPQYYPDKSSYRGHVTFNDNAMINALKVLQDIKLKQNGFG